VTILWTGVVNANTNTFADKVLPVLVLLVILPVHFMCTLWYLLAQLCMHYFCVACEFGHWISHR